jgi:hypothetical protein
MPEKARGGISVTYEMPRDGQLTLGLFDKSGRLLKWLVQDEYRYAGKCEDSWDGLDQWGNAVAVGDYDLKAAYHSTLKLDYQLTVANPGTPSWPTPDGKGDWLSDEATPQAAATDGKWVFLAAPGSEKGCSVIGVDENGQRRWGVQESFNPRCVSLALAGDNLYVLYSGPEITDDSFMYTGHNAIGRAVLVCLNKKTGAPEKFTRQTPQLRVATWPYREAISYLWDLRNKKAFSPFNYGGQPRYSNLDIGESTDALGIAAVVGKLYISLSYENKLLVLDAETGKPTGDAIPLDSPAGLAVLGDHTLLAVSGTKVVQVDLVSRGVSPFISTGLSAPDSIALDRQGQIYVSDWGDSFQVKAFDQSGKFLRAIGKAGGRPWVGKWNCNGMLLPRGIAVTDDGKLWVAEDDGSPKRISVWKTNTGAFIRDYLGPTPYGGGTTFWIDPRDQTKVHAEGATFKVDYDKKTSIPEAIDYRKLDKNDPFTPNGHDLGGYQVRILHHDDHEYAFTRERWNMVSILQRQGKIYKPVSALGSFPHDSHRELTPDSDALFSWDSDIMNHVFSHYFPDFFAGHLEENYAWTDRNGDGLVQPDEMQWVKTSGDKPYAPATQATWMTNWNIDISPDFSAFFPEKFADRVAIMRLDVKNWTPAGAPIYDLATAKAIISLPPERVINTIHVTNDGKLIVGYNFEDDHKNEPESIECFDLDGKSLWSIAMPNQLIGKNVHANCVAYDYNVPGIGDVICTWLYHGSQKPFFFTSDGIYVGTVLDETLLGPTAIWSESARYFYQSPDGTPFIINGANQQEHIFKIKGLEGGGRFTGSLSLSQGEVDKAATMRKLPEIKVPPKPVMRVAWLGTPPVIDGDLSEWNMNLGVSLDGGKGRTAEIALARDKDNLYLAYQVHEPTAPLVNGGSDWHDLFVSGDCVDLMLGTNAQADPHRRDAGVGDERLLISVFQGQPIAVLYQPKVPGTTTPIHLAAAQIDRIIRLDSAQVAVKRSSDSYTLEARVPLKDLSIDPAQSDSLSGDVGVIYADQSGRNRAQRLYYYNKNTDMVADLTTETNLQPSEWGRVEFPLGPNLIRNGGFEEPLVNSRDRQDQGWFTEAQKNGNTVNLSTEGAHSGQHGLLMETPVGLSLPSAVYDEPNYETFLKSFNQGKGGGYVEIMQRVPVIGGHTYSLRYFYRNEDFQEERKEPGHPRGYVAFGGRIEWGCQPPRDTPKIGIGDTKENHADLQEMMNYHHGYDLPQPYLAPEEAITATILFEMATNAEGHTPKVFLDDIEFVDVTPVTVGQKAATPSP